MPNMRLGTVESCFADIVWENAPLTTRELIELCEKALQWKRTTTYTVLKKFCERGIFQMKDRVVTVLLSRDAFYALQSEEYVKQNFQNSLPSFIAAFTTQHKLTAEELAEIKTLIESLEENM